MIQRCLDFTSSRVWQDTENGIRKTGEIVSVLEMRHTYW